jgi:hypothetical protein
MPFVILTWEERAYVPFVTSTVELLVATSTAAWMLVAAVAHVLYGELWVPEEET